MKMHNMSLAWSKTGFRPVLTYQRNLQLAIFEELNISQTYFCYSLHITFNGTFVNCHTFNVEKQECQFQAKLKTR